MSEEICDRCRATAAYRVTKDKAELFLCSHHGRGMHKELKAKGWEFWPLGYKSVAPQGGA